jgi:hypothetical protein
MVLVVYGQRIDITLPDPKVTTAAEMREALVAAGL